MGLDTAAVANVAAAVRFCIGIDYLAPESGLGHAEPVIVAHDWVAFITNAMLSCFRNQDSTTMREEPKLETAPIPEIYYDLVARIVASGFRVSANMALS